MASIKDNLDEQEIMDVASAYIRDEGWILETCDETPYDFIGFYHGRYDEPEKIAVVAFRTEHPNVTTELIRTRDLPDDAYVCLIRVDSGDIRHITFNSMYYLRNFQFAYDSDAPKPAQNQTGPSMLELVGEVLHEHGWDTNENNPEPAPDESSDSLRTLDRDPGSV